LKLSGSGEQIGISQFNGQNLVYLDSITFGQQFPDTSFGRYPDGTIDWEYFLTTTPGSSNISNTTVNPPTEISNLFINEFLAINVGDTTDNSGEYDDWIELYNADTIAVNIGGLFITDNLTNPTMWQIPDSYPDSTTIQPGEFLVLWADKDTTQGILHTNIKLTGSGENIAIVQVLGNDTIIIDSLSFGIQSDDISFGRYPDGSSTLEYFSTTSFRAPNIYGSPNIQSINDLYINELLASNTGDIVDNYGENEDWIELYNAGTSPIDIGGLYFTDSLANQSLYQIPNTYPDSTTIAPGGFLVLWADNDTEQGILHLGLKLSGSGEQIGISQFDGQNLVWLDSITFGQQIADTSFGRYPDGTTNWESFNNTSPGSTNVENSILSSPNWNIPQITTDNHVILIPNTANITINGIPIENGDWIGTFYDSVGTLVCAGSLLWEGITNSITAWGADIGDDGFVVGEVLKWKIWDASEETEFQAIASYDQTTFPNTNTYSNQGISGIESLNAFSNQTLDLPSGWSIFSTYILPNELNIDSVFVTISQDIIMIKSGNGLVYWPEYFINNIVDMIAGQGYLVKMLNAQTIDVEGIILIPEVTEIPIVSGWSIIGYLRQSSAPIDQMLSDIVQNIIMVKSGSGLVYWPTYFINNIGDMHPGQGYRIKLTVADTLIYSANTYSNVSKSETYDSNPDSQIKSTGSNMVLGIPNYAWTVKPKVGSEINVFSESGILVGKATYQGKNMAITIWGNDKLSKIADGIETDEKFIIKLCTENKFDKNSKTTCEIILEVENWIEGDEYFSENKISVIEKFSQSVQNNQNIVLYQNIPNPFKSKTQIKFYLPKSMKVEITTYNLLGEKIECLINETFAAGNQTIEFSSNNYPSGTYFYKMKAENFEATKYLNIIKR